MSRALRIWAAIARVDQSDHPVQSDHRAPGQRHRLLERPMAYWAFMFGRSIPASRHTCIRSASFHGPAPCGSLTPFSLAPILPYCSRRILCPDGFASLLSPLWQRDFRHELLVPILGKPLISARRPIRLDLSLSSSYSRSCAKNRGKPLTKLSPSNASGVRKPFIEPAHLGQGLPPHERVGGNQARRPLSSLMRRRQLTEDTLGIILA